MLDSRLRGNDKASGINSPFTILHSPFSILHSPFVGRPPDSAGSYLLGLIVKTIMHMRSPKTKKRSGKAEAERQALVRALAGKYAATNTNSEAFARRKAEEIELEEHIRTHRNK